MRAARTLAGLVAAVATLVLAAPASATFPGRNGFVVYASDRDGNLELWAQNLDGSNQRKLLDRPGTTDADASWSPSGKRLVFSSGPADESNFDLYLLNADGTGLTPLLVGSQNDLNAQFCDENTVVFQRANASLTTSDIYAIETDGTGLRPLTDHPAIDYRPTCTPDGTTVAFASTRAGPDSIYEIPLAPTLGRSPAGAEPTLLVSTAIDPDYSPDGKSLAYGGLDPVDGSVEVFVRDLATGATRQISSSSQPLLNRFPRFFPDQGGAGPLLVWTQFGPVTTRVPAGNDVNGGSDDKSSDSNAPECNGNGDNTIERAGLGPLGVLELCFAPIASGGVAVIRPIPLVPKCRCKDLTVGVSKASFGSAEGQTAGRRLTRLFFNINWGLTCSAGIGRECRATFSLDEPAGFEIRSMHRLEKQGRKTIRVPDPNPVSCKGRCNGSRETSTDGTVRVALNSSKSLGDLAGESFTLELETRCAGTRVTTRILVRMGNNGRVKGVAVEQP